MNAAQMGGKARALALDARTRSRIARKAVRARWARRKIGILQVSEIRRETIKMLEDMPSKAYLFGSYARGEARVHSDVDLMIVVKEVVGSRLVLTAKLREKLKIDRDVDLLVVDESRFNARKNEVGTVDYEVFHEGVRLV